MRTSAIVLGVLVLLCVPLSAHSTTWYVIQDGSGDATTIQAGIDLAAAGDIVLVAAGTYTGLGNKNLDFDGKDIVLRSEEGPEVTIIDCEAGWEDPHRGFFFHSGEGPAAVVEGFMIKNGNVGEMGNGAGMYITGSSPTVANCIFSTNLGNYGGGVYCSGSSPTFTECTFSSNHAWRNHGLGGGMHCTAGSSPMLADCMFSGNEARSYAGMYCRQGSSATLTDCIFLGNVAFLDGGGMGCVDSSPTLTRCIFVGNLCEEYKGGGMACIANSLPILTYCTFLENSAYEGAGGMYCGGSSPTISNCIFSMNSGDTGPGGGLYSYGSSPTVANCTFSANSANGGGGICCYYSSSVTLDRTIIAFSTQGEAVYCDGSSTATLTCCDVYGNAGGNWVGCIADQNDVDGNISADPLFCGEVNYPSDPYRLDIASPCARRNPPCLGQLIGARGTGCSGPVVTEPVTWGRIKVTYR